MGYIGNKQQLAINWEELAIIWIEVDVKERDYSNISLTFFSSHWGDVAIICLDREEWMVTNYDDKGNE